MQRKPGAEAPNASIDKQFRWIYPNPQSTPIVGTKLGTSAE